MKVLLALTTLAIVYRLFAIIIADIPLVFNYPLVSGVYIWCALENLN